MLEYFGRHQGNSRGRPRCSRPVLETLEERSLLSGTPGNTDFGFDGRGYAVTNFYNAPPTGDFADAVLKTSSGKYLVAGSSSSGTYPDEFQHLALASYNADGTPNTAFGGDGEVVTDLGLGRISIDVVEIRQKGSTVFVLANVKAPLADSQVVVACYDLNTGGLVPSWNDDGLAVIGISGRAVVGADMAVQADGKVVVVGGGLVFRLDTAGEIDANFQGGNAVVLSANDLRRVIIKSSGAILVAGTDRAFSLPLAFWQLTPSGQLDASFDGDGVFRTGLTQYDSLLGAKADGDDLILLFESYAYSNFSSDIYQTYVARLPSQLPSGGTLSTTRLAVALIKGDGVEGLTELNGFEVLPSGDYLVQGVNTQLEVSSNGTSYLADHPFMARLSSAGTYRQDFGNQGYLTDFGASDVLAEADGTITVASFRYNSLNGSNDMMLGRLTGTGSWINSFGQNQNGQQLTDMAEALEPVDNHAVGSALQWHNGQLKIVVAGWTQAGVSDGFALARYLPDGRLDETFGAGGRVVTDLTATDDHAHAVAVQQDGKIVVVGTTTDAHGETVGKMVRYLDTGARDLAFGTNGIVTVRAVTSWETQLFGVVVQPDGKIVVGGSILRGTTGSDWDFLVTRYKSDGTPDSFGWPVLDIGKDDFGYGLALDSAGRVVLSGYVTWPLGGTRFGVVRLLPDGSYDHSFSGDGFAVASLGDGNAYGLAVAIDAQNNVLVTGEAEELGRKRFALARFRGSDGVLDTSMIRDPLGFNGNARALDVGVQPDGKIVVVGNYNLPGNGDRRVVAARYLADGGVDVTFASGGAGYFQIGSKYDTAQSLLLQPDGKIAVVGWTDYSATDYDQADFAVLRIYADGAPTVSISSIDGNAGVPHTFTISATDPSQQDLDAGFTYRIDWNGDGVDDETIARTPGNGTKQVTHTFTTTQTNTIRVTAVDVDGLSSSFTQTVRVNYRPIAHAQTVSVADNGGSGIYITLTGDDANPEVNQPLIFALATQPAHGTLTEFSSAVGLVRYTPAPGFAGTDSFTFTVTDNTRAGGTALTSTPVAVTVNVTNSLPTANAGADRTGVKLSLVTLNGTLTDQSVGDSHTFRWRLLASSNGQQVADGNGRDFTFMPLNNGTYTFEFKVTDSRGAASTDTVVLSVINGVPPAITLSPQPGFGYASRLGGTNIDDGKALVTDAAGNVYVTGDFRGTVDFDPGPGTFNLSSNGSGVTAAFVSKLDTGGNLIWARRVGGGVSGVSGEAIAVDGQGNVFVSGSFMGTADFDPGSGTSNLTSASSDYRDAYVSKLDAAGNFVWARRFGGATHDFGRGVTVDGQGNVYTTGYFQGTADFDPGAGTFNLTSAGSYDPYVCKLDGAGNFAWARQLGGTSQDESTGISVDGQGNVYTTGSFQGTADFDPGAGTFNLTSAGALDAYISKLDPAGNFVWARRLGGTASDTSAEVEVDGQGNVYTTGYFSGTADFDPGAATFNLTSISGSDTFVSKLDSAGNFVWARHLGQNGRGNSIAVDGQGNVYTTGYFQGTADFDPGAAAFNLTSAGSFDVYISKLNAAGIFVWAERFGGTSQDEGNGIAVDSRGNVYSTGYFQGSVNFDPGTGIQTLTSAGSLDTYVSKLNENQVDPVSYTEHAAPTPIAGLATATDPDNNFIGGSLTARITTGARPGDRLSLPTSGSVFFGGGTVSVGSTVVGTAPAAAATGNAALTISFNTSATAAQVTAVLKAIRYDFQGDDLSDGSRTLTLTVTDATGGAYSVTHQINVFGANDAPADLVLSQASVAENLPAGTLVGTFSVTDPDAGTGHTLRLVADAGGLFVLAGDQLLITGNLNFEASASHTITAQVTDAGGLSFEKTFVISVTNVNDVPTSAGVTRTTAEDTAVLIDLWALVSDAETPTSELSFQFDEVVNGMVELLADGHTARFLPTANFHGAAGFDFRTNDGTDDSPVATVDVTVNSVNDAPVPTAVAAALTAVKPGTTNPTGDMVGSRLLAGVSDADADARQGIAVTAVSGSGRWQYQLVETTAWIDLGTVSNTSALLLRDADRLRFVPAAGFASAATLTYRTWDQTSGTAGTRGDVSASGGATAFSAAARTATLVVNTAPVLAAGSPKLIAVTEDNPNPPGQAISTFASTSITDPNPGARKGIAVTATTGPGRWQYQLFGTTTWNDVPPVSASAALLLGITDKVRFVPSPNANGSATLSYRAWDQTAGAAGTQIAISAGGDATSFSLASQTARLSVAAVNDAPVLGEATSTLTAILPGTTNPSGDTVGSRLLAGVSDADGGAKRGIAVVAVSGAGKWQFQLAGTTAWKSFGTLSTTSALRLRDTDKVRFVPALGFTGTATLTYRAWDQTTGAVGTKGSVSQTAFSTATRTATLPVNTAPVLAEGSPTLAATEAGSTDPVGDAVSVLLAGVFSDADTQARRGIAVVGTTGGGTWQWWDSTTWQDVGVVSANAALLLRDTDRLRFVPAVGFVGTAAVTYRGWDQTEGLAGDRANILATGGATTFSDLLETATLEVGR